MSRTESADTELDAVGTDLRAPDSDAPSERERARDWVRDQLFGSSLLAGRYRLIERIGQGGMGFVHSAVDEKLDRRVAIKLLDHGVGTGRDAQARLYREALVMARVANAHVVPVFDVGTADDGRVFVAMEFVEGQTLRKWSRVRPRSWQEVVGVLGEAGRGLAAAHAAGVIHRDFKPDNVMVDGDGRARVLDFGLARALGDEAVPTREATDDDDALRRSLTRTGAVVGTPTYMAPEQFARAPVDERTDQFSFCVALYEALYGGRPFSGDTLEELMAAVKSGRIGSPPSNREVPAWLRKAVLRGLSTEPARRFATMDELLGALSWEPSQGRRRWRWIAGGSFAVTGAVSGLFAWQEYERRACAGADAKLAGVWDSQRKQEVERAMVDTGIGYAPATWTRVERQMDVYAEAWVQGHVDACTQTHVLRQQSESMMDERIGCLTGRLRGFGALVDVFADADATVVSKAVSAVEALPDLDACADPEWLGAQIKPPEDSETAALVERHRDTLALAKALEDAGKYPEAFEHASDVVERARNIGYPPLLAEALLRLGFAEEGTGRYEAAHKTTREAYFVARRVRLHAASIPAATHLVTILGVLGRYDSALEWSEHADAEIGQTPSNPLDTAWLDQKIGIIAHEQGKLDEALDHFRQALSVFEREAGPEHGDTGDLHNSVGAVLADQGKHTEALDHYRRALAISEIVATADHPRVATTLGNMGRSLQALGKLDEALDHHRRALAITEAAMGPDHTESANTHNSIGAVLLQQGKLDEAIEHLREALERWERSLGSDHPKVAGSFLNIGIALGDQGKNEEALDYAQRGLASAIEALGPEHYQIAVSHLVVAQRLRALGRGPEALDHGRRAVTMGLKVMGSEHPMVATMSLEVGEMLRDAGSEDAAQENFQRAIAILSAAGPDHADALAEARARAASAPP